MSTMFDEEQDSETGGIDDCGEVPSCPSRLRVYCCTETMAVPRYNFWRMMFGVLGLLVKSALKS